MLETYSKDVVCHFVGTHALTQHIIDWLAR